MAVSKIPPLSARLLAVAGRIRSKRAADLSAKNLSEGHDGYLMAIHRNPGITMGDLASLLEISPSSTTKIATKLEALGLVRREASRIDSRQNHAFLTDDGTQMVNDIAIGHGDYDAELVSRLKGKDADRLMAILDRLEGRNEPVGKKPRKAGKKKRSDGKKDGKKKPKKQKKAK
ncbi:MarR family winged helix-turn-helix transcriptional regulator [Salaquimonas pukyongi]|uniref:MarR family winged helix-turn-helix transcriptional regulator n=1 Tax=Salaquimonas pukyongi TaxID=2712698 RepID=UPI0013BE9D84|nr:MarR family transcriptional regulator [Salaquimonas pukyongi]